MSESKSLGFLVKDGRVYLLVDDLLLWGEEQMRRDLPERHQYYALFLFLLRELGELAEKIQKERN